MEGVYDDWMDQFLLGLKDTPPVEGEERVLYPGLYAYETEQERKGDGIPYHPEVLEWYKRIDLTLTLIVTGGARVVQTYRNRIW